MSTCPLKELSLTPFITIHYLTFGTKLTFANVLVTMLKYGTQTGKVSRTWQ